MLFQKYCLYYWQENIYSLITKNRHRLNSKYKRNQTRKKKYSILFLLIPVVQSWGIHYYVISWNNHVTLTNDNGNPGNVIWNQLIKSPRGEIILMCWRYKASLETEYIPRKIFYNITLNKNTRLPFYFRIFWRKSLFAILRDTQESVPNCIVEILAVKEPNCSSTRRGLCFILNTHKSTIRVNRMKTFQLLSNGVQVSWLKTT